MEYFLSILVGIVSGLLASYIFVKYYIQKNVPNVVISSYISFIEHKGRNVYMFKFVNKTDVPIFDVRLELTLMQSVGALDGRDIINDDISLADDFFSYIPTKDNNDIHSLHAYRAHTDEDIRQIWGNNTSFLRLTIMAKHSLTGLNKVFFRDFNHNSCIDDKDFEQGDNLNLLS